MRPLDEAQRLSRTGPVPYCSPQSEPGAPRVFEMQLMPALLLGLQVNEFAAPDANDEPDGAGQVKETSRNVLSVGGSEKTLDRAPSTDGGVGRSDPRHRPRDDDGSEEDEGQDEAERMPVPSAQDQRRMRTWGMDWGVVTVWSCPQSCEMSCEEEVVVQQAV